MEKSVQYLFVYGSLRKGFGHSMYNFIDTHFTWISNAKVKGLLYDAGEYPAAIPSVSPVFITGELYLMKPGTEAKEVWSYLDVYEGLFPQPGEEVLFRREKAMVQASGTATEAWIYWYNLPVNDLPVITSGDILQYR
ncbi:MAG: gamma-glutamylcyclotransferase family protein [Chitinophagaceae bacterium]